MNERNMPSFNTESIKKRICRVESLLGRTFKNDPMDIDLMSQIIFTFAGECGLVQEDPRSLK